MMKNAKVGKFLDRGLRSSLPTILLIWKQARWGAVALIAMTLMSSTFPILIAYLAKLILDSVIAHDSKRAEILVTAEFGLVILQGITVRGLSFVRSVVGSKLSLEIQTMVLTQASAMSLEQMESPRVRDQLNRASTETALRPLQLVTNFSGLLHEISTIAGYLLVLISFHWAAALLLLVASIPATILETRYSSRTFQIQNMRSPQQRWLGYLRFLLTSDHQAKEIKIWNLAPGLLQRFRAKSLAFIQEDQRMLWRRSVVATLLALLSQGAYFACYLSLVISAIHGSIALGSLAFYAMAFQQSQQSFQSAFKSIGDVYENNLYMSNLFEFLKQVPQQVKIATTELAPVIQAKEIPQTGLVFQHVHFRYTGSDRDVLSDLSFHVQPGQSVAIIGMNGAGKSTLAKLICRLYDPSSGQIYLDGRNLRDWDQEVLWNRVSALFQEFNRYQFSLRENVNLNSQGQHLNASTDQIIGALQAAGADDLIRSLPDGLESQLGRWFENGTELSGGQWQKVALSRVFLRKQADLLILDEPTSAMDAKAEEALYARFRALTTNRMSFIISHRFPTARLADQIMVLAQGRIVELGSHEELIRRKGQYEELFTLQARGYL